MEIVEQVKKFALEITEENKLELYDIEYLKEDSNWVLRLYIDKDGGVMIDDCELVSRALEKILDDKDFIKQSYILEVSSPGLDRKLKKDADYIKFSGNVVNIKLHKSINKKKSFKGILQGINGDKVVIADEKGNLIEFEKSLIASCRLEIIL